MLLLHLLNVDEGLGALRGLLSALDKDRPVLGDGHLAIERRGRIAGFNVNGNIKLARRLAAKDAVGWGDVGVVATYGGADMTMVGDEIVGRIEANPAEMRQQDVDPCVRGVGGRAVVVFAAAIEVAGDVASRDAHQAEQGDHGVGEVLADAAGTDDGFVDGRIDAGGAGDIFEVVEETLIEFLDEHQGIVTAGDFHLRCQQGRAAGVSTANSLGSSISQ